MAWWPSSRGLTGFASAVLRALFDGFDGMVASGAAARYQQREGKHRTLKIRLLARRGGRPNIRIKKVPRLNKLTDESAMNGR